MTEHLAFQQLLTERRAVDRHKILPGTLTIIMYGLRKDFLSRTRFARQQYRHVRSRDFPCQ